MQLDCTVLDYNSIYAVIFEFSLMAGCTSVQLCSIDQLLIET
jgi:hypothetical protein